MKRLLLFPILRIVSESVWSIMQVFAIGGENQRAADDFANNVSCFSFYAFSHD
jgi:hypothetical protein